MCIRVTDVARAAATFAESHSPLKRARNTQRMHLALRRHAALTYGGFETELLLLSFETTCSPRDPPFTQSHYQCKVGSISRCQSVDTCCYCLHCDCSPSHSHAIKNAGFWWGFVCTDTNNANPIPRCTNSMRSHEL